MQNYTFIYFFLDSTESEASVIDDDSQVGMNMEEEAPPAKEPDKQIIIGKKCPFLYPLQGLKCRTTHLYFFLDLTESEASVMEQDGYDLDGCLAEVKSVITEVLEESKTGASQQYDPLTMLSLPGIPGNILIQFLAFCFVLLVFGATLVLLSMLHFRAAFFCKRNDSQCC